MEDRWDNAQRVNQFTYKLLLQTHKQGNTDMTAICMVEAVIGLFGVTGSLLQLGSKTRRAGRAVQVAAKIGNGGIGLYRNAATFGKSAADFFSMTLSGFGATTSATGMASGISDAAKTYRQGKEIDALKNSIKQNVVGAKENPTGNDGSQGTGLFLPDEYYQRLDDDIAKAIAARDAEVARIQTLSKTQQSNIATVVAVDLRTGSVCVGVKDSKIYKGNATCAEDIVFRGLGGNTNANIIMTPAIKPRTGEVIPVCTRCQTKHPQNQFMKGTTFK